jgi:type IV pilus assembly protein PilN
MSTRINLLDWRAERRAKRKQQFTAMLGLAFVASAALVGLGYFALDEAIDGQNQRNQFLTQQIADLDLKIKEIQDLEKTRQNLLSRMKVIEQLQQSRSATVHFFDEIVNTIPDGIYLTSVKQNGQNITIDGIAESSGRISAYLKNLDSSPWFKDPRLVVIKTAEKNKQRNSEFQLQVTNLTKPSEDAAKSTNGVEVVQ